MEFGLAFGILVVAAGMFVAVRIGSINRGEED